MVKIPAERNRGSISPSSVRNAPPSLERQSCYPVILCGGSGTRLWPLSRRLYPKQFVDLGGGRTLFKDTLERVAQLENAAEPLIVCNEHHRFFVSATLLEHERRATVLLEPAPRNTAPAIALAAFSAQELQRKHGGDDPVLLVLPSDHMFDDTKNFAIHITAALPLAREGYILTFGITPTGPETGFGYMQQGNSLKNGCFTISRFVEKPDAATAQSMLHCGDFFWNSGIFLCRAATYLAELQKFSPDIYSPCAQAWAGRTQDGVFIRPQTEAFMNTPSDSIDYAVMEHTDHAAMMPLDLMWNDLGTWEAFYQVGDKDDAGNVRWGDIMQKNSSRCYLHGTHRLVAAIGLQDVMVVETQDAVLVAQRTAVQDVKNLVLELQKTGRKECVESPLVYRPWGSYETLAQGKRFQVKRIIVNPGAELSLQMHHHRAEHWVVVSGTAEITNGETVRLFTENQSTYIPLGTKHRLKNPGIIPLILIEIQSGSYLGEDDIVRFDDKYGRTKN